MKVGRMILQCRNVKFMHVVVQILTGNRTENILNVPQSQANAIMMQNFYLLLLFRILGPHSFGYEELPSSVT
jgi:hypothetical protein